MKRVYVTVVLASAICAALFYRHAAISEKNKDFPHVAVTQIAPHPSLDLIYKGLSERILAAYPNAKITHANAQGNLAIAAQIARHFAGLKPDAVVAITTPSAQTIVNAFSKENVPVIFCGVSDPVAARILPDMTTPQARITGISDAPPLAEQLRQICQAYPKPEKITFGLLYCPGEVNAVSVVDKMEGMMREKGFKTVRITAASAGEIQAALVAGLGKIQALYIPNDNVIISGFDAVLQALKQAPKPVTVFASDPESVDRGATAAVAYDQYAMGEEAGEMVVKIVKNPDRALPVVRLPKKYDWKVNSEAAEKAGLNLTQQDGEQK